MGVGEGERASANRRGKRTRESGFAFFVLNDISDLVKTRSMATKLKVAFDPRAEALSPWLWIPISVVALGLFVFLSISRREIIFAAYDSSLALSVPRSSSLPKR